MKTRLMLAVFMITLVSVAAIGCHSNLSQLIPSPANTMTPTPTSNANQVSCPDDANMAIYNYMSDLATTSHGLDVLAAFQQVFSEWGAASFWPNSQITSGSYGWRYIFYLPKTNEWDKRYQVDGNTFLEPIFQDDPWCIDSNACTGSEPDADCGDMVNNCYAHRPCFSSSIASIAYYAMEWYVSYDGTVYPGDSNAIRFKAALITSN